MNSIHHTAIISEGAVIGNNVFIGPYCIIGKNVILHDNCILHSNVVIDGYTEIGNNNEIYPFSVLGYPPQDFKYSGEKTKLKIGKSNIIREHVTMHSGTVQGHFETVVGNNNLFMVNSHIGHDCIIKDNVTIVNNVSIAGHVEIDPLAIIAGNAGVHQYCRIGKLSFVAAGAMVSQDVPPFCIVKGDRARVFGLNNTGLKRHGFNSSDILVLKKIFKTIFSHSNTISQAIEIIKNDFDHSNNYISDIIDFISNSNRGICRPKALV